MLNEIKQDLHPRKLAAIILIGIVVSVIDLPQIISISALIYSGDLAQYASLGIGIGIMSAIIVQFFAAFGSSRSGIMGGPQDSPAAVLAVMAASMSASMVAASQEMRFATVLMTVMLTTFFTGAIFLWVGWFNLSRFVRFLPYPVIGGFISGTGLLIAQGGFSIMTDTTLGSVSFALLFQPTSLLRWIPGLILALILLGVSRKSSHFLVMPILLFGSIVLFYAIVLISGNTLEDIRALGWLLGPFPKGALWKPLDLSLFAQVDWRMIASQVSNLFVISVISIVALLLNVSALELIAQKDIDAPRELKVMGMANIVTSLLGGAVSYHYLGLSGLTMRMKANSRLVGVTTAILLGIVLLFGATALSLVPKFVIGGLLVFLGASFLMEWVYDAWFRMPKLEYLLVLAILAVVGGVGFLEGVGVGIIGAVILFAVNYGQIDVVNNALTSVSYRSNMERPTEHYHKLDKLGNQINILRLHGFVFFGTAHSLLNRVRSRINDESQDKLKYLILDFHRVTSLDSSAAMSIIRIHQLTKANTIHLIFTDVAKGIKRTLELSDLKEEADNMFRYFPTLDYGAEWCETRILIENESPTLIRTSTLQGQFNHIFGKELAGKFMTYLVREKMDESQVVFQQGDPSDSMFFIESGQVTASFFAASNEKNIRLRTMGAGTVVGEIAFYLNQPRTATIVATKPSVIYRLTFDALKEMEKNDSGLAVRTHTWLAKILSQRVADYNKTLEVLLN